MRSTLSSGADIANICNEAAILAARNKQKTVTLKDLDYAHEKSIAGKIVLFICFIFPL